MTDVDELITGYRTVGASVARGFIGSDLLAELTREADELLGRFAAGYRSDDFWCYDTPDRDLPILYRIHHLEAQGTRRIGELFAGGILHPLAERFLGPGAYSTVCAMVVKTKGVPGVPWHRDRVDVPPGEALNLSVYLDPSDASNGCFEAVPGSHRLADDADVAATRTQGPCQAFPAGPGDVLIHDVRLVHGSGDNDGGVERRSIIIEFARPAPGGT